MKKKVMLILSCLFLSVGLIYSQTISVNGVVVDSSSDGIVGASVVVKGTQRGVTTGLGGAFSLNAPANSTLVFSLVGMQTKEVDATSSMRVVLESDAEMLDEVVVVAYGTVKKSAFTGSVGVVDSKSISKLQVSSVTKALEGTVAGLQVASDGGQPGSDATLRIRGYGSLAAGNSPLIVLDGTVYDGTMNSINSQDIESVSVLKDAASSALYGSRAANGVILITTKKGKEGKPKISLDVKQGFNVKGMPSYDVMTDPGQYLETYWQSLYHRDKFSATPSSLGSGVYASQELLGVLGYNPYIGGLSDIVVDSDGKLVGGLKRRYTDKWVDEAYRVGYRQEYNLSINSGNKDVTSYMSFGYLDDSGIIDGTGFKRFSVRENITYNVNNFIRVGANISYARTTQDMILASTSTGSAQNMFVFVSNIAPIYPVYMYDAEGEKMYDDGKAMYDYGDGKMPGTRMRASNPNQNPIAGASNDKNKLTDDNFVGRGFAEVSFLDYFKATFNLGYDVRNNTQDRLYNRNVGDAAEVGGRVQKTGRRYQTITMNQLLNYNRTFDKLHNVSVLLAHESYEYKRRYMYAEKTGMFLDVDDFDNAITMTTLSSYRAKKSLESYFGQLLYDFDNKYYFSASFRRDGSSVFHKDNRWGNFWSVGGSWRIKEEKFMAGLDWLNNLRLRTSYGVQGNDAILDSSGYPIYKPFEDQYTLGNNNGKPGLSLAYKGNKDLKWEDNANFNVGLDLSIFANRLNLEFDFYIRKASDLLYNRPEPLSSGYSSTPVNIGDMQNKGIEFSISGDIIRNKDLRWNVTFLGTHNKNKILKLPRKEFTSGFKMFKEGGTISDYYILESAGVDPDTGKALWYYPDKSEGAAEGAKLTTDVYADAVTAGGRFVAGSTLPKFVGAFNMLLEYKNFDLSIMTNFQIGGYILDENYSRLMHGGSNAGSNWHKDILNAWTEDNRITDVPRLDNLYRDGNSARSTRFLIKSDYLSLRNITLGYTFPKKIVTSLKINGLRATFGADNIALFSKRKGLDPRQALSSGVTGRSVATGSTDYGYTPIRSFSFGLAVDF